MYVRPPDQSRNKIKIPENYSGHAFREPRAYSDMPPPLRLDTPQSRPIPPEELSDITTKQPKEAELLQDAPDEPKFDEEQEYASPSAPSSAQQKSLFSSLLPPASSSGHFPFGHGIGSEEILILALMLTVYLSGSEEGKIDHELLILLGLLLFAG